MLDKIDWNKIEEAFLEKFVPYDGDPHPAYEYQISEKDGRNIFTNFFKSEIEKQVKEISSNVPVSVSLWELGSCLVNGHLIEKARRNKANQSVQIYNHHAQPNGKILIEGEREDLWNTLDKKYWDTFTPTN